MPTSGLLGTVVEVDDDELVLDIGNGVHLRYVAAPSRPAVKEPDRANPSRHRTSPTGTTTAGHLVSGRLRPTDPWTASRPTS